MWCLLEPSAGFGRRRFRGKKGSGYCGGLWMLLEAEDLDLELAPPPCLVVGLPRRRLWRGLWWPDGSSEGEVRAAWFRVGVAQSQLPTVMKFMGYLF